MAPGKCCACGFKPLAGPNNEVYCSGPILERVQMCNVYPDSKTFVDMSLICTPEKVLQDYCTFSNCKKNDGSVKFLQMFVENHFKEPGSDLEPWLPPDWQNEPPFMCRIADPQFKKFGSYLNCTWKKMGRRIKDDVKENPDNYSIVYVPNPFIVPGGRFLEMHYWDTYWIVRGLLYSGMQKTARGMIENLLYLVRKHGSIPSGGRIYYSGRSQPPLLIPMIKSYVDLTKDEGFAQHVLPLLEVEFEHFVRDHAVQVNGHIMYVYRDNSSGPRPESYRADMESANSFCNDEEKEQHYSQLKAACESGMDFSSRWFISKEGTNVGTMKDINTTSIVPVDLNAIIYRNCKILAEFHAQSGNIEKADEYRERSCQIGKAIREVLWNEKCGVWLDYDLMNNRPRCYYAATNLSPLWLQAFKSSESSKISESVLQYIKCKKLDQYPGGVPMTLLATGQQWDFPNVWPPLMYMLIEGLENLGTPEAKEMSKKWAHRWVKTNFEAFNQTGEMYEKYNCEEFGGVGCGGEYEVQTGFGWTNGIMIEYLAKYGGELSLSDDGDECAAAVSDAKATSASSKNISKKEVPGTTKELLALCSCTSTPCSLTTCLEDKTANANDDCLNSGEVSQYVSDDCFNSGEASLIASDECVETAPAKLAKSNAPPSKTKLAKKEISQKPPCMQAFTHDSDECISATAPRSKSPAPAANNDVKKHPCATSNTNTKDDVKKQPCPSSANMKAENPCSQNMKKNPYDSSAANVRAENPCSQRSKDANKNPCASANPNDKALDPYSQNEKKNPCAPANANDSAADPCSQRSKDTKKNPYDSSASNVRAQNPCSQNAKKNQYDSSAANVRDEDPCSKRSKDQKKNPCESSAANDRAQDPCSQNAKKNPYDSSAGNDRDEDPCSQRSKDTKKNPCESANANDRAQDPCSQNTKKNPCESASGNVRAPDSRSHRSKDVKKNPCDLTDANEDPCSQQTKDTKKDPCESSAANVKAQDPCSQNAKKNPYDSSAANVRDENPCSKRSKDQKKNPCESSAANDRAQDPCSQNAKKNPYDSSAANVRDEDPCSQRSKNTKKDPCESVNANDRDQDPCSQNTKKNPCESASGNVRAPDPRSQRSKDAKKSSCDSDANNRAQDPKQKKDPCESASANAKAAQARSEQFMDAQNEPCDCSAASVKTEDPRTKNGKKDPCESTSANAKSADPRLQKSNDGQNEPCDCSAASVRAEDPRSQNIKKTPCEETSNAKAADRSQKKTPAANEDPCAKSLDPCAQKARKQAPCDPAPVKVKASCPCSGNVKKNRSKPQDEEESHYFALDNSLKNSCEAVQGKDGNQWPPDCTDVEDNDCGCKQCPSQSQGQRTKAEIESMAQSFCNICSQGACTIVNPNDGCTQNTNQSRKATDDQDGNEECVCTGGDLQSGASCADTVRECD